MGSLTREPSIGAHIRADKGLHGVFAYAKEWNADVIQVFTASPRQYRARALTPERIETYREAWKDAGAPLVISHASYLVNLASPKEDVRARARVAFGEELVRCAALEIPYVVLHLGSALDSPRDEALGVLVEELNALAQTVESSTRVLLETSAGQGSSLGITFDEIAWTLDRLTPPERFGACLDTCHVFAAGYDLRGDAYTSTWEAFEAQIGLDRLDVLHLNDSRGDLGSRVDRHEHIGKGFLGDEPFRRILRDARLRSIPCFIETPDDLECHRKNLARLRKLARADA